MTDDMRPVKRPEPSFMEELKILGIVVIVGFALVGLVLLCAWLTGSY